MRSIIRCLRHAQPHPACSTVLVTLCDSPHTSARLQVIRAARQAEQEGLDLVVARGVRDVDDAFMEIYNREHELKQSLRSRERPAPPLINEDLIAMYSNAACITR